MSDINLSIIDDGNINLTVSDDGIINVSVDDSSDLNITLDGVTTLLGLTDVSLTSLQNNDFIKYNNSSGNWENSASSSSTSWGDILGTLSNQTDLNTSLGLKADDSDLTTHTGTTTIHFTQGNISIPASQITDFDTEVSNNSNVASNTSASHAQSHNIASHSDTTATGAELNTLTGGGDTTLHDHDGISENTTHRSSDGTDHSNVVTNNAKISYPGSADATELNILDGATLTTTELNYVDGVTSSIQTQLNAKGDMNDLVDDTTPQLGGNLDMNQKNLLFDPTPTSDHTWNGEIISATAGESVVIGDVCYLKSDGKFWKVDADAEATSKGMCVMSTGTISADATGTFLLKGFIRDDTWAWTIAAELWCSLTPGNPTATKPSVAGDIVRLIGYAYSADIIYFNPDKTYIEIAA